MVLFRNIYNTFYDLRYHYCHSTVFTLHTVTKQKVWGDLTVHTHIHDNSTTFLSDSKLKGKIQGSFFITLIDILKDIWLQSVIRHQNLSKDHQLHSTVCSTNPEHKKMKEKVGTFISPKQIFIIMGLSDCAANKSFIFKPFWISS